MRGTPRFSLSAPAGTPAPCSHRLRASHGSWDCVVLNETRPPPCAGASDLGPPCNQRAAVSFDFKPPLFQTPARNALRITLPIKDLGRLSRNSRIVGTFYAVSSCLQYWSSSRLVSSDAFGMSIIIIIYDKLFQYEV